MAGMLGMLGVMPEPVADATLAVLGEPTPDEQRVSPDVQRIMGHAPRPLTAWAQRHGAAFR